QRIDAEVAIAAGERFLPHGLYGPDIVEREAAAEPSQVRDDGFTQIAAIKVAAAMRRDGLERCRELGLAHDVAQRHACRATGVGVGPIVIEGRPAAQERDLYVELGDAEFGERETVAGQSNRRCQGCAKRLFAIGAHQLSPSGKVAGGANRQGATLQVLALAEALDGQARGYRGTKSS